MLRHFIQKSTVQSRGVSRVVNKMPTVATYFSRMSCSGVAQKPPASSPSAVNVEEFTLNDDVVRKDLENMSKWNLLSEALSTASANRDYTNVLQEVQKGLAFLDEVGPLNAPIQCECLLCMEASQAHYNLKQYDQAQEMAERAKKSLLSEKKELQDRAQIAEIEQFQGFILCEQGRAKDAHEMFTKVLHWIDVDAKSAMPMQAVAAVNLRRVVVTGLGQSMMLLADQKASAEGQAKEEYGKALDVLIEGLNQHIDENDFNLVKATLKNILHCFEGVNDVQQAVTTCKKFISWCERHDDEEGVAKGKEMLADLETRHNIKENPSDS